MAGGFSIAADGKSGRREFKGKITWYVWICGIIAATCGLMFGYDIGISGKKSSVFFDLMSRVFSIRLCVGINMIRLLYFIQVV